MMKSTETGYVNRNDQENMGRTGERGDNHTAWQYQLKCTKCGHTYLTNGSDIFQRRCPNCQVTRCNNKVENANTPNISINLVQTKKVIDSYERFLDRFQIDRNDLYQFGIEETILPEIEVVDRWWEVLKKRIYNNGTVSIRGYGRDARGTALYIDLYKHLFHNMNVKKDPTNNMEPQKIICGLTGYKRNRDLFNYQVSHIFGRTKNIFLFEAPWNIALVPKLIDPFTGHETKGIWPQEYQERFVAYTSEIYMKYIDEYNQIIDNLEITEGIAEYIDILKSKGGSTREIIQFEKDVASELSRIVI